MSETKLQVLRGEHEHCLILTELLKEALNEKDFHKHSELVQNFLMKWQGDLDDHFKKEEGILLPAYARYASIDDPDFNLMFLQHVDIRRLVFELREKVESGERVDDTIIQLVAVMTDHVLHEEEILFPKMEATIPHDKLLEVVELMKRW